MGGEASIPTETSPPPQPPLPTDLSVLEEGKSASLSHEETKHEYSSVFQTNSPKMLGEFFGTYIIIFAGCGSVLTNERDPMSIVGISMVWGMITMVMIYTLGHVSGGHFNPAITIALAVARKFPWKQVPLYVFSQVMGSTVAILALQSLFEDEASIHITVTKIWSPTFSKLKALAWEFSISCFKMFAVCGVATDQRAVTELSGIAVGSIVLLNTLIAGSITGASMNPARSIGPAVVSNNFQDLWIYIVGPILGAMTATVLYCPLRSPIPNKSQ